MERTLSINVVPRKYLWGRAGNRCAYTGCSQKLIDVPGLEAAEVAHSAGIVLGEEAHIRSSKDDGPRYDSTYPSEKVDGYENLILLCPTHHTKVDKNNGDAFSVDALLAMKEAHEKDVDSRLGDSDREQQELNERTAISIAVWERKIGIDTWPSLTFGLNMPTPCINVSELEQLKELCEWLLKKRWDKSFQRIAKAFENHRRAMSDLNGVLSNVMDVRRGEDMHMRRETVGLGWDEVEYERCMRLESKRIALICALTIEATRTVNFAIDAVIADLDPYYRFDEGLCLMFRGDGFTLEKNRLEYSLHRVEHNALYPGLDHIEQVANQLVEDDPRGHNFGPLFNLCEIDSTNQ